MIYFYSHIISIDSILIELHEMDLNSSQKAELASLIDSIIHHQVLDHVLSRLVDEDKKIFMQRYYQDPQDKELMEFIGNKVDNIESEIIEKVEELKSQFQQDIKEANLYVKKS